VNSGKAQLGLIDDKVFLSGLSPSSATFLYVETSATFDPSAFPFHLNRHSPHDYSTAPPDVETAIDLLSRSPDVLSVFAAAPPVWDNRLAAGYSQRNTRELDASRGFARVFEAHNVTGSGVVVTLIDTYLDTNSTFFYDPKETVTNGTYNPYHRKVVYNRWHAERAIGFGEHGTHTSGTVAGRAVCSECLAPAFNGVAPGAKLAFFGWPNEAEWPLYADILVDVMNRTGSVVTSNSWHFESGPFPPITARGDNAMFENPDKLFFFSAGNKGQQGLLTIGTPAEGKNVIAVGALSQFAGR
jgi:subtilisin family serine protease